MVTIKQMEAVYWLHHLGSFQAVSDKLHATQSTISKRIQEFESNFATPIFERTHKGVFLTRLGHSLLPKITQIIDLHRQIVTLGGDNGEYAGKYRVGTTEIVALTWLPDLVARIRDAYPKMILEPQVDLALSLIERLEHGDLDMVIAPELPRFAAFDRETLGQIECDWLCSPKLLADDGPAGEDALSRHPLLMHADGSAVTELQRRRFESLGLHAGRTLTSNSTLALAQLAKAGLGLAYLPIEYFRSDIDSGALRRLTIAPGATMLNFVAAFRHDANDALAQRIAAMAKDVFRA